MTEPKQPINLNAKEIERIERQGFGFRDKEQIDWEAEEAEETEIIENFKKNMLIVKEILEYSKPARNYDWILQKEFERVKYEEIITTSGENNFIFKYPRNLIKFMSSPETVGRCRRRLITEAIKQAKLTGSQKDKDYLQSLLPTDKKILEERLKKEKALREYFREQKNG